LGFRPGIDLRAVPIEEIRDNTAKGAAAMSIKFPPPVVAGLVSEDREIPTSDGATILVRIYKLDSLRGRTTPTVILYVCYLNYAESSYHGGGFVLGDIDREDGKFSIWTD
jgi:acetyl esterase/lipase